METTALLSTVSAIGVVLVAMAAVAGIELVVPLHARGFWHRRHVVPNLTLTFLTFAINTVFNVALLLALVRLESEGFGLLRWLDVPPLLAAGIAVVVLDFSFYVAHVSMHKLPYFWRFHAVHHSDPAIDVTTTIRQHPGEGVIRYVFLAVAAIALGASPGAFAVYRLWSVLSGLQEHANVRVPLGIDRWLSLLITTPNMHKVHHSRDAEETDTNYGNIFPVFDRIFGTFTPSERGCGIAAGLDGFNDPAQQTTAGLLASPFVMRDSSRQPELRDATSPTARTTG